MSYEYYDEDVFLAGVPNLWQFDYACGAFGTNAIGCGPVAASMVMYWWAQQGYEGLVEDFLSGSGSSAADREHDWREMVETFRDDYLNGGICVADQYATLQGTMRDGMDEFIGDAGYDASVRQYKVCDGCNRNANDEITEAAGLDIILDELRDGRPVILGFNVGRAMQTQGTFDSDFFEEITAYTGELSNGTPATGIISHYAVITGYARADGHDILLLNLGWADDQDIASSGSSPVSGPPLHRQHHRCGRRRRVLRDRPRHRRYLCRQLRSRRIVRLGIAPEEVLADQSCGILREVHDGSYYPTWSGVSFECDPYAGMDDIEPYDFEDQFNTGATGTGHAGGLNAGSNAPILDEQLPLP